MSYPANIIKGIPKKKNFISDGFVIGSSLFEFKDKNRDDNKFESSINWEDDKEALNFTLNQKNKDDSIQFEGGVVLIPRDELDRLKEQPTIKDLLSYERSPIPKINKYHGNILFEGNTPKHLRRRISGSIANLISKTILRD